MLLSTPLRVGFGFDLTVPKVMTTPDKVNSQKGGLADICEMGVHNDGASKLKTWGPLSMGDTSLERHSIDFQRLNG